MGYYYHLSHRFDKTTTENSVEVSELRVILDKDLVNEYPGTPRAVIKFYNRILSLYYSEELSNTELTKVAAKQRMLLDDELLDLNPEDTYLASLKAEITDYKNRNRSIISSDVCNTNEVEYATVKGRECAYVVANYFTKEQSSYERVYQQYVLRKTKDGKWKILTFRMISGEDYE